MKISLNKFRKLTVPELAFILTILKKYKKRKNIPDLNDLTDEKWKTCEDINLLIYHTIMSKTLKE